MWRAVFREVFQLAGVPVQAQSDHILAQLATEPDLLPLAPLLNVVLPFGIPENAKTAALAGQAGTNHPPCRIDYFTFVGWVV